MRCILSILFYRAMLTHSQQVIRSYRTLLKTINQVFANDPRMKIAGSLEARKTYERFRNETDPEQLEYLLSEAKVASDFLYREIIQVKYDDAKGKHFAKVEERHLKNDDGTPRFEKEL